MQFNVVFALEVCLHLLGFCHAHASVEGSSDGLANVTSLPEPATTIMPYGRSENMEGACVREPTRDQRLSEYSLKDSNAVDISPVERLLRVAASIMVFGEDGLNWSSKWRFKWDPTAWDAEKWDEKVNAKDFFDFAYQARFGQGLTQLAKNWILEFDEKYRSYHQLPSTIYDALAFATSSRTDTYCTLGTYLLPSTVMVNGKVWTEMSSNGVYTYT